MPWPTPTQDLLEADWTGWSTIDLMSCKDNHMPGEKLIVLPSSSKADQVVEYFQDVC